METNSASVTLPVPKDSIWAAIIKQGMIMWGRSQNQMSLFGSSLISTYLVQEQMDLWILRTFCFLSERLLHFWVTVCESQPFDLWMVVYTYTVTEVTCGFVSHLDVTVVVGVTWVQLWFGAEGWRASIVSSWWVVLLSDGAGLCILTSSGRRPAAVWRPEASECQGN